MNTSHYKNADLDTDSGDSPNLIVDQASEHVDTSAEPVELATERDQSSQRTQSNEEPPQLDTSEGGKQSQPTERIQIDQQSLLAQPFDQRHWQEQPNLDSSSAELPHLELLYKRAPDWLTLLTALLGVFLLLLAGLINNQFTAFCPGLSPRLSIFEFIPIALSVLFFGYLFALAQKKIVLAREHVTLPAHLALITFGRIGTLWLRFSWVRLSKVCLEHDDNSNYLALYFGAREAKTNSHSTLLRSLTLGAIVATLWCVSYGEALSNFCFLPLCTLCCILILATGDHKEPREEQSIRLDLKVLGVSNTLAMLSWMNELASSGRLLNWKDCKRDVKSIRNAILLTNTKPAAALTGERIDMLAGDGSSYTALWTMQLRDQSGLPRYASLPNGHQLQDGRIKVIDQIATGGFSSVYLVELELGAIAVMKESSLDIEDEAARAKTREFFEREARILCKLNHPRLANIMDHFVECDRDYLLIEYLPGMSLRQYIHANGAASTEDVINWAIQLADVLKYLHSEEPPVVHRDLTPDNVIINNTTQKTVHLIDFGSATEFAGTATSTLVGKQAYLSPEQFKGKTQPASDIYAFGCTLSFALTGKDPRALASSCPDLGSESIAKTLAKLIADCTNLEAAFRPSAASLKEQLNSLEDTP